MSEKLSFAAATMAELGRRKVLRTVGAYAVGVFVLLQLMDAAVEPLRLPDWLPTLVVLVLILGFPLVFILAYVGVKMVISNHYHIPDGASMAIIVGILLVGIVASICGGDKDPVPLRSPLE